MDRHQAAVVPADEEQILGVRFSDSSAVEAVRRMIEGGGLLVIPASPALLKLKYDDRYRRALQAADLALLDSSLVAICWKLITGRSITKIAGFRYLQALLETGGICRNEDVLFVVPSAEDRSKAVGWLDRIDVAVNEEAFYIAPEGAVTEDHALLLQLEERRPKHVIIATRSGAAERLGFYLREYLLYRPAIHCVGAALGFLSGAEAPIPQWADRLQLGWLARMCSQPRMALPRVGIALTLATMIFKYRSELPRLRARWADL